MADAAAMSSDGARLHRCIRDLAALNALPSMCIGRSPEQVLDIVLDALPTALSCELIHLALPGSPPTERASFRGTAATDSQLSEIVKVLAARPEDAEGALTIAGLGELWCFQAEIPVGKRQGRLWAGRSKPLDPETDRVLVRSAANLVGTTLETANVLDFAQRKDEFMAMLGHELRNPLAPILTAVELLARVPEANRERLVIERHTRHLARLVDDLLDISRVTRGNVELRSEQVALGTVLERAIELAAPLVSRYRHALRADDAQGVTLQGDPVRLAQVFSNLLTNAAKFTAPGGTIEISIERAPGRVAVSVRDNGRGIPREQQSRIFEPFAQVETERDALRGGLGLGLAIVSNLVTRHQGTIRVHSAGQGLGSTFTVDLPTVVARPREAPVLLPKAPSARAGVRILVVDDNIDVAELLSEALEFAGFTTAVAHDGQSAVARWRTFFPHAAVLDVGLPGIDGYDLARSLRAEHGGQPTLIAATGYGQQKDRQRALSAGFNWHLVKPVSIEQLVALLDQSVVEPTQPAA